MVKSLRVIFDLLILMTSTRAHRHQQIGLMFACSNGHLLLFIGSGITRRLSGCHSALLLVLQPEPGDSESNLNSGLDGLGPAVDQCHTNFATVTCDPQATSDTIQVHLSWRLSASVSLLLVVFQARLPSRFAAGMVPLALARALYWGAHSQAGTRPSVQERTRE